MDPLPDERSNPLRKRPFQGAPAAIIALSMLAGTVAGKSALPETGQWLPAVLPVIGVLSIVEPAPLTLMGAGLLGGAALEGFKRSLAEVRCPGENSEFTLQGKAGSAVPGKFGGVNFNFEARENLSLERTAVRLNMVINMPGGEIPIPGTLVRIRTRIKGLKYGSGYRPSMVGKSAKKSFLTASPGPSFIWRGVERLDDALDRSGGSTSGLLGAVSLGQRWRVGNFVKNTLNRTGTYHLMAVSGVHLASSLLPAFFIFRVLTTFFWVGRNGWRSLVFMVFGSVTLAIYLSMTGLSTSAARAGFFLLLTWLAFLCRRDRQPGGILGWCVILITCVGSRAQPDPALLLSAGAVLGILAARRGTSRVVEKVLGLTLGAVLFTLPLSVWFAGGIPLLSLVCNVTAGLIFGAVLIPFAVLIDLTACCPRISLDPVVRLWDLLACSALRGLELVSNFKGSFLVLSPTGCLAATTAGLAALAVWKKWNFRFRAGLVLFAGVAFVAGTFEEVRNVAIQGEMTLCFPRVGQADAAILRSGGRTIVIDCAAQAPPGRTSPVVRALSRAGTRKIDAVFLTHAHPDHIGGFEEIASRWKVGALYLPVVGKDPDRWSRTIGSLSEGSDVVSLVKGDTVKVGSVVFSVLGPDIGWEKEDGENAGSLILHVVGGGFSALFTGDARWDQVQRSLDGLERLDLIKIPHHGSKSGFPPPGLEAGVSRLRRRGKMTAVFPSPPPGMPELPAREVVDWFEIRGIPCVFTGSENGVFLEVGRK